jgi:DNA modification methylase
MTIRQLVGDCRALLPSLPDESVHCVVTSPPYFGLRDYGTAKWEGGDDGCDHTTTRRGHGDEKQATSAGTSRDSLPYRSDCGKCGARRIDSQLGLEPSYQEHVEAMVAVFREVRRVLRHDGTLWLNYGDSYAGSGKGGNPEGSAWAGFVGNKAREQAARPAAKQLWGLKPKDLCGIPWRVAFALQADGWWLRQDIIWSKPNPMPESVTDRCTKAHEYIFLLTKSPRYYFDAAAIAEPGIEPERQRNDRIGGANGETVRHSPGGMIGASATRNKRSVWHIATAPYSEAHFATFPPALIEPCILAGCPAKCCAKCGAPWVRELKKSGGTTGKGWHDHQNALVRGQRGDGNARRDLGDYRVETLGFSPSCACAAGTVPGTVLDPFSGAGTTGLVADRLQRNAIMIDLSAAYAGMAAERIRGDAPLFVDLE